MAKLLMLQGLPASGKSTYAKKLEHEGWVRVNKDKIREDLTLEDPGWTWSYENEKVVVLIESGQIEQALAEGKNVVVDSTNFGRKHKVRFEGHARKANAEFEIKRIDVPLETCLERNKGRKGEVPEKAILDPYYKYVVHDPYHFPLSAKARPVVPVVANPTLPPAILCDLDGTLAHNNHGRSFYDATDSDQDSLDQVIYLILHAMVERSPDITIVYLTGREEIYRDPTQRFLDTNLCPIGPLIMRPKGDSRKDAIVKMELFDAHIRDKFHVLCVLDDRDQVVKMWRSLGLKCLQVAEGSF